jgi:beta-galactosidase GanA
MTIARIVALACVLAGAAHAALPSIPYLRRQGAATQLIVDGQPLLFRGGEVGNSAGEPDYLRPDWPRFKALRLNGLVVPVCWDVIEPAEGRFDFATVDRLIADARENDMRLVLLWFGSWKNSMSCYAPGWVKRDRQRFPRSQDSAGRGLEILSPFHAENREADARSFAMLMRHLREIDGARHTVVMVQVENEIGMIPEARDRNPEAEAQFAAATPADLISYLVKNADTLTPEIRAAWLKAGARRAGTWSEVFGPNVATDEFFMAWHFARYVDAVAAAGKKEYPLPMYVNAALIRPGHLPGQYPSAGPLPHLFDLWRAGAPAIDFLSPDIYFQNFSEWARRYARDGNPLFIPEALRTSDASVHALYTFAALDGMGFCPFGIESIQEPAARQLADALDLVGQLAPLIAQHQGQGTMAGILPEGPEQRQPQQIWLGGYVMHVSFERGAGPALADGAVSFPGAAGAPALPSGGLVIAIGPDEFLFAGTGITATFAQRSGTHQQVGLVSVEEGRFVDGKWTHVRWLNGDETNQGRHLRIPPGQFGIQRVKLYRYD